MNTPFEHRSARQIEGLPRFEGEHRRFVHLSGGKGDNVRITRLRRIGLRRIDEQIKRLAAGNIHREFFRTRQREPNAAIGYGCRNFFDHRPHMRRGEMLPWRYFHQGRKISRLQGADDKVGDIGVKNFQGLTINTNGKLTRTREQFRVSVNFH